jgi:hypothetical protein
MVVAVRRRESRKRTPQRRGHNVARNKLALAVFPCRGKTRLVYCQKREVAKRLAVELSLPDRFKKYPFHQDVIAIHTSS